MVDPIVGLYPATIDRNAPSAMSPFDPIGVPDIPPGIFIVVCVLLADAHRAHAAVHFVVVSPTSKKTSGPSNDGTSGSIDCHSPTTAPVEASSTRVVT